VQIFPGLIRVRPENRRRSLRRMRRRIDAWQSGELDEDAMSQSLTSIEEHLTYFCLARKWLRRKVKDWRELEKQRCFQT